MIELDDFIKQLVKAVAAAQLHVADSLIERLLECFEAEEEGGALKPKTHTLQMPEEELELSEAPAKLLSLLPIKNFKYKTRSSMVLKKGKLYIDLKDGLLKKGSHVDIELELTAEDLPEVIEQVKDYLTDHFHKQTGEG